MGARPFLPEGPLHVPSESASPPPSARVRPTPEEAELTVRPQLSTAAPPGNAADAGRASHLPASFSGPLSPSFRSPPPLPLPLSSPLLPAAPHRGQFRFWGASWTPDPTLRRALQAAGPWWELWHCDPHSLVFLDMSLRILSTVSYLSPAPAGACHLEVGDELFCNTMNE